MNTTNRRGRAFDTSSELYKQMYASIHAFFRIFLEIHEARSSAMRTLYLVSGAQGTIMFTAMASKDLGAIYVEERLKTPAWHKLYENSSENQEAVNGGFRDCTLGGKACFVYGAFHPGSNDV